MFKSLMAIGRIAWNGQPISFNNY